MENNVKEPNTELLRESILHLLTIYPVLSPTMLQSGLGPYVKAATWRPLMEDMIEQGLIVREQETLVTPHGRHNTYTKLSLYSDDRELAA